MQKSYQSVELLGAIGRDVAEFAGEHCKRGVRVLIRGELKTDTYEKEGQKHYSTKIVAESIYLVPHTKRAEKAEQPAETQNAAPVSDDLPF